MNNIKTSWLTLFSFAPIAIVAILLNQRNYAIGDDYHAFGFYFVFGGMDFSTAVATYWKSPFSAGRPFAAITELLPLSMIHSINQLNWIRYLHLAIFGVIFSLFWKILKRCKDDSSVASWIALFMFTLPAIWHMYLMNYGTPMLLGLCTTLLGAHLTVKYSTLSFKQWLIFSTFAAFAIFSYQPAWPLLFIGLFGKMLSTVSRVNDTITTRSNGSNLAPEYHDEVRNYSATFVKALGIVLTLFLMNFVLVKFGYNSQRLSANIDWIGKLRYLLDDLLPTTIYPWLYIWFPGQLWLKYLSWATYVLSIIAITFTLIRSIYKIRGAASRIGLSEIIFFASIATSLIPATLGMYLFTDQAIAFRRVMFASMTFWFTLAFFLACILRFPEHKKFIQYTNYGFLSLLVFYVFAFGYFLDVGTVQLASREWNAAVCASKQAPLSEPARVNTKSAVLPKPIPEAWSGDEFQTSTFSFPTGGMLVYLAHWEASHSPPKFNLWTIELTESSDFTEWDSAYIDCLTPTK